MHPQTDEQRGKRAFALTAWRSILRRAADCRRNWTTALIPRCSGTGTHPTLRKNGGGELCLGCRKVQSGTERDEGARPQQHNCRVPPARQMVALGPTGERQEHLDAIVSFAGVGQKRRLFRGLDILPIKWATGDLLEECRFFLNTELMFLKKEKDPSSKQFDDDEWIRSLTEAQEITADVPEDSVSYDQQDVDPKKVRPI